MNPMDGCRRQLSPGVGGSTGIGRGTPGVHAYRSGGSRETYGLIVLYRRASANTINSMSRGVILALN